MHTYMYIIYIYKYRYIYISIWYILKCICISLNNIDNSGLVIEHGDFNGFRISSARLTPPPKSKFITVRQCVPHVKIFTYNMYCNKVISIYINVSMIMCIYTYMRIRYTYIYNISYLPILVVKLQFSLRFS